MTNEITGTSFHEEIFGTDGDDIINGLSGYDTLDGGNGSDVYLVNPGDFQGRYVDFYNDTGTSGTDVILATAEGTNIGIGSGFSPNSGIEIINGLANSRIVGENEIQIWDFSATELLGIIEIHASGGNDTVRGSRADDFISGGNDNDTLYGDRGHDTLHGDHGQDVLHGEWGRDSLYGGDGHDVLFGGNNRDFLFGDAGHDILNGGKGRDTLSGGAGYDTLDGGEHGDIYIVGLADAGFVDNYQDTGTTGTDRIIAVDDGTTIGLMSGFGPDSGIEVISARGKDDVTIGGTNDAEIWDFSNTILRGIDGIYAGDGMDHVTGSARRDFIHGEAGHDQLYGGGGHDWLFGGADSDFLFGEVGRDRLFGGDGNDILNGGEGRDRLTGGEGYDIFVFGENAGRDRIMDFDISADLIDFSAFDGSLSFEDLSFNQNKRGVWVYYEDNAVFLHDVATAELTSDMFIF